MSSPVKLIGLPTDRNSSHLRGPAKAPSAIRTLLMSGMSNLCSQDGVDLEDPDVFVNEGDVDLREDAGDFARIVAASKQAFSIGTAVFLGGDHFVTWPIIEGLVSSGMAPPHLVHIDAHPDLYPDFEGNPESHASPMARLNEKGRLRSLTQIGIRTVNAVQQQQIDRYGVTVIAPSELANLADILPSGPTYITIDLDGLDPAFAPGVSHHEPGGLSVREVLDIIWKLPGPIIGADIVELNPERDINDMTAAVAVKLLKELVARIHRDQTR
ncbi:MAG: agmatinase [Robiginitomaculum sp.]|nr:MAG: agmatinase [Robiginitomaculum sp.]